MTSYSMFTPAGNREVGEMIASVVDAAEDGSLKSRELAGFVKDRMRSIACRHLEVHDTEVEEVILDRLDEVCDEQGWVRLTRDDL